MSADGICQLIMAFAGLAAFLGTGILCLVRGDQFPYAVLKAGGSLVGVVVLLRFLTSLIQGVWSAPPRGTSGKSGAEHPDSSGR